jgi:hypothetical protein
MFNRSDIVPIGNQIFEVRDLLACLLSSTYTDIGCSDFFCLIREIQVDNVVYLQMFYILCDLITHLNSSVPFE